MEDTNVTKRDLQKGPRIIRTKLQLSVGKSDFKLQLDLAAIGPYGFSTLK